MEVCNKIDEAKKNFFKKKLMENKNFRSLISKRQELEMLFWYYFAQENYKKALEVAKDSLMAKTYSYKLFSNAGLGNKKYVDSLLSKREFYNFQKASVYAILNEKDSMYHYLSKTRAVESQRRPDGRRGIGIRIIISRKEFDPYRKEERYKAFLKKYYLPITHWNE